MAEVKIRRLEAFISENPALADIPALMIDERPTTLREALVYLRTGRYVDEVLAGLEALGLDLPWELAKSFYRRLAAARPEIKIVTLGFVPPISPAEALEHIEAEDEVGRWLVESYAKLLSFVRMRVDA